MSKEIPVKRIMMIVNPKAGKLHPNYYILEMSEYYTRKHYETAVYYTSLEYGAGYLVKEHAEEYDIIVCSGGDGTINEVISGLMQLEKRPPIGYIPAGTTNDLAASLGMTKRPRKAGRTVLSEKGLPFDVGSFSTDLLPEDINPAEDQINGNVSNEAVESVNASDNKSSDTSNDNPCYFAYIAAFGAFTEAAYNTSRKAKNLFGRLAYIFSAMKCLHKLRSWHLRVKADGIMYENDYIFCAVTNSTSVAGLFKFERDTVDFADGKFEVLLINRPENLFSAVKTVLSMINRSYKNHNIRFIHASDILIESDEPLDWTLDGEHKTSGKTVSIHNENMAVRIIRKKT